MRLESDASIECVAFLYASLPGDDESEAQPIGTCFFMEARSPDQTRQFIYLVTAKHVLHELMRTGGHWFVRLNIGKPRKRGELRAKGQGVRFETLPNVGWLTHPDDAIDLAVLPWRPPQASGTSFTTIQMEAVEAIPGLLAFQKLPWPPGEGEDVLFVGMMIQFQGEHRNLPIVRRGSVALTTDEPIKGAYGFSNYYVIEAQAYQGNSGGPVWSTESGILFPLGVLVFSYPDVEELRKMKDVPEAYYNLGISLVTPMERVVEIVDSQGEQKRRGTDSDPARKGVALSGGDDSGIQTLTREDFERALKKIGRPKPASPAD